MIYPDQVGTWKNAVVLPSHYFKCGYCSTNVAPKEGYLTDQGSTVGTNPLVYICSGCGRPTFIHQETQTPSPSLSAEVSKLEGEINTIYEEARQCTTVGAFTSAILTCRKIVMHVAVEKGAEKNLSFVQYVDHLKDKGWMPPNAHDWVDEIRKQGNEANHEIVIKTQADAEQVMGFVEMLLRFMYELPARVRRTAPPVE